MDRAGDQDDGLAFGGQLLGVLGGGPARIGELLLDIAITAKAFERRRIGHGDEQKRPAFGGLTQLADLHAIALRRDLPEVRDDVAPLNELTVRAHPIPEMGLGARHGSRCRHGKNQQQNDPA